MDIVWKNPPLHPGRRSFRKEFVEALKQRPGEWGVYPKELTNNSKSAVVIGNRKAFPGTEWTWGPAESGDESKVSLYARWVGVEPLIPAVRAYDPNDG